MPAYQHAPLSRHEALAPFSRDHYTGLVQAQHLIKAGQADDVTRRKAVADFVDAFDHKIAPHFRDEERLLGGVLTDADRDALFSQHRQLTQDAERMRELRKSIDPDPDTLAEVGQRLNEHIRWEERELFNRIQQELSGSQIEVLQRQTAKLEATRPRDVRPSNGQERPQP